MTFPNRDSFLEDAWKAGQLTEKQLDAILEVPTKVSEPTRTVIGYLTDISALFAKLGYSTDHGIYGGYGVLAQLVSKYGDPIIPVWRGSDDIDMFGTIDVLNMLRSVYDVQNDRPSPNIDAKFTLKIKTKDDLRNEKNALCKIDYSIMSKGVPRYATETIHVLGVPIVAATPLALVRSKLEVASKEAEHLEDIYSMLGVLEYRNERPENVTAILDDNEARRLQDLFLLNPHYVRRSRLDTAASPSYVDTLKQKLENRLNIKEETNEHKKG